MLTRALALLVALAALAVAPSLASASGVAYPDADWTEVSIPSPSAEAGDATLHADILRPKGATDAVKTPVILSIGPYFNHSGQVGAAGPVQDAPYDPAGPNEGPSERFQDLIEGTGLLKKGYTFVMVDLRGFGGSDGCLDWSGPGEQADVINAVKWAATRSWSTGKVGMYGKSYDGLTGLIGVNHRPPGLAAVVSQEPVYDDYRYLYGDGMRRTNSLATPALYDGIAASPGPLTDDPNYNTASLNDPVCLGQNFASQAADDNHDSAFWKLRNLIPGAAGSPVPLFLTQGFTENNTVPDGMQQYLDNHTGYERAWLGPWDHVRGNERDDDGKLLMGREGWFDEVLRFYDRFLKGVTSPVADPPVAVQTNDGKWRSEAQWPPADKAMYATALRAGSYTDHAQSYPTGAEDDPTSNSGVWTISKPLPYDVHLAGSGSASVDVTTSVPNANLVVDVYHLDANGEGPLVSRQAHLVRGTGQSTIPLELWSADWKLAAGHRIGVRVTDNNQDFWLLARPTLQPVTVRGGSISLPFLRYRRTATIAGERGVQLDEVLADTVTVPADTLASSESDFTLPPPLADPPPASPFAGNYVAPTGSAAAAPAGSGNPARRATLAARLTRRGRTFTVSGTAPARTLVRVALLRNGRRVAAKRTRATRRGAFGVTFLARRRGVYRAVVAVRSAGRTLTRRTAAARLR
jgi:hypothetical protein